MIDETHCAGCDQAILKQFVEHVDLPNQIWHPECYMIYKFWGAKLAPKKPAEPKDILTIQNQIEKKVTRVWTDLSSFEESSANCISDMLLNVAAGAYTEGIRMANQFIMHLQVLFDALDAMEQTPDTGKPEQHDVCALPTAFFFPHRPTLQQRGQPHLQTNDSIFPAINHTSQ